ncbi:MAG: hypothetical protein IT185_02405 [Acidobacteria bacterium]|nr:hypothetical protein [Acidobacteriota bacterium]
MSDSLTIGHLLRLASDTHVRASRLAQPATWLVGWHERKFVHAIDHFAGAVRRVPQAAVEQASDDQIREIGTRVDAIVNDVEVFIAGHGNASLKRVERDRHLVRRIYELRASYEKLSRRVTADPAMTDLRWKVKLDAAHRGN